MDAQTTENYMSDIQFLERAMYEVEQKYGELRRSLDAVYAALNNIGIELNPPLVDVDYEV